MRLLRLALLVLAACPAHDPSGSSAPSSSSVAATAAVEAKAPPLPDAELSRSPADHEWSGAPEVEVEGARALGCVGQAIREHVRVTCRPAEGKAGPTELEIEKFTGMVNHRRRDGVAFLEVPLRRGTRVVARFAWGDTSHRLLIEWPQEQPSRPSPAAKYGEAFPTPPRPCAAFGAEGNGTFSDPCVIEGAAPVAAKRAGDHFEIDNGTEHALTSFITVVYYYDASGERLDDDDDPLTGPLSHSFSLVGDDVIQAKSRARAKVGVRPTPPKGTHSIEVDVCRYGLAREGRSLHFLIRDRCREDRPRSAPP
jgi:hypothetical protein